MYLYSCLEREYLSWRIGLHLTGDLQLGLVLGVLDILHIHLYGHCGQIYTRGISSSLTCIAIPTTYLKMYVKTMYP